MSSESLTLGFEELKEAHRPLVGGKGANLGVLVNAGVPVPPGFCVTSVAFERFIAQLPDADAHFDALDQLDGTSPAAAQAAAERIRAAMDSLPIPDDVREAVLAAGETLGLEHPVAVRSSATAEDLPGASFAGQQDTYLNVRGEAALLDAVRRCWISLFTDRAVLYRARGGFGHRAVFLAVVVQRMVSPEVSGILFTADPVSGHRHIASIDAGFGLGEALVGGLVSADLYRVDRRRRVVMEAKPGDKAFAIRAAPEGGTSQQALPDAERRARALDDDQVLALADIGARIEALYGGVPQDIEWCIAAGAIWIVQARPITSLFPIPAATDSVPGLRVYVSFGHIQMMVDAMPRLSLEVWRLFFPAGKAVRPTPNAAPELSRVMVPVAGRLYLDATALLRVPRARKLLLGVLSHVYEALGGSVAQLVARPEFLEGGSGAKVLAGAARVVGPVLRRVPVRLLVSDPERQAARFHRVLERIPQRARARIDAEPTQSAKIRRCTKELNGLFWKVRRHLPTLLAAVIAHRSLARLAEADWADAVRADVDVLQRGLPGNVTTEMDLAVGDLTDLVRPHPELAALLEHADWPEARRRLPGVAGGAAFLEQLDGFLEKYGVRGAGEIDISRPRWKGDPSLLLRVITGGLFAREPGAHRRQHAAQVTAAEQAAARILEAAGRGLRGPVRRAYVARLIRVIRAGLGLREHPKLILVKTLALVRAEVQASAETLRARGQLEDVDQVWHLGFEEIATALDDESVDLRDTLRSRVEDFARDRHKKAPLVISSDGETPAPIASKDLPPGALPGTAASSGVVEGLARVVTDPQREVLRAGEILVAPFTDPGWTPLFVHAAGVVTEVGGLMTHGAVVAREYGIPAVVSVASAVTRIKTGQRIVVDGTRGFVRIIEDAS